MNTETVTVTPLRREINEHAEIKPLPRPRTLSAQLQRGALAALSKVAPALTIDVLYGQYFTPFRYRPRTREREILNDAQRRRVHAAGREVVVYEWGAQPDYPWERRSTKSALLVHGWSGAAAQMTPFVAPLLAAGYSVRAFDWPAHGRSRGAQVNVAEVADVITALAREDAAPVIVAHSLGGSAALISAARGLDASAFVLFAAGARLDRYPLRFAEAVGAGPAHGVALKERLVRELGDDVIAPGHTPLLDRALDVPALFVHDVDDAEMPHEDSRWLASRFHHAHLVSTAGLGHRRILKDAPVLAEVIRFLERT